MPSGVETPGGREESINLNARDTEGQGDPPGRNDPTRCNPWLTVGRTIFEAVSGAVILVLLVVIVVLICNQPTAEQIQNKGVPISAEKDVQVLPPCGEDWIWYQNKCFYFSEVYGNWPEAEDSCAALNSSLALIDTQDELNFMLRYKGGDNHWIGLRRDDRNQHWTWVNGTKFNNWFTISNKSECVFLGYGKVKSLECDITNKWICTRRTIYI